MPIHGTPESEGGLWLSFLQRRQTLSVAAVQGDDLTGVYLSAGLTF